MIKKLLLFGLTSLLISSLEARILNTFLLCGPFSGELETEYIKDEALLRPNVGFVSSDKKWKIYSSVTNIIDFEDKYAFGYNDNQVTYAYVEIYSDDFGKLIELKRVVLLWETAFAKSYNFAVSMFFRGVLYE
ncbi:MAG: hypothetical protein AB1765_10705 [Candidatus Hydrogenedentota bacterium]